MKIKLLGLILALQSLWFAGTIGLQEWKLSGSEGFAPG